MTLDTNVSPYYDDFDQDKKFVRILFNPSVAVQSRELTQSQSILQNQIKNFGDHFFEDGSMVLPGVIGYDANYSYVKLEDQYNSVDIDVDNFAGKIVTGQTSGVSALVINTVAIENSDPNTLYIKYLDSGTDNITKTFTDGEVIETDDGSPYYADVAASSATGTGSSATIQAGVFYVYGFFLNLSEQTIILDKYTNTPSYRIGLEVVESIVTSNDDNSLNDVAQGSPNFAAPGADRYKIDLVLAKRTISGTDDEDFIEVLRLENGEIKRKLDRPDYAYLEDTMARRTYDESGNYTVRHYGIDIREHLDDGSNRGIYTAGNGGDATKIALGIEPGKAYVNGYEVENISTQFVDLDKARDTDFFNNSSTPVTLGNYLIIDGLYNFPTFTDFPEVELYDTAISVDGSSSGTQVGTAKVRGIELHTGTAGSGTETYKLYLFDIDMSGSNTMAGDAKSLYMAGSPAFTADIVLNGDSEAEVYEPSSRISIFRLPQPVVEKVRDATDNVDTTYSVRRIFSGSTDVSGNISFNAGANETFVSFNTTDYLLTNTSDGSLVDLSGKVSLGGSPTGSTVTLALGGGLASTTVKLSATVTKEVAQEKTKTLQTDSVDFSSPTTTMSLGRADVFQITGIYDSENSGVDATTSDLDITSRYSVDTGQRDNFYDIGSITLKSGSQAPTGRVLIEFEYFSHGAGDYFSVDSYTGQVAYGSIPTFISSKGTDLPLRDCLDFRPRINDAGTAFTGTGGSLIEPPKPSSTIRADFHYYLNRIDKLYINENGEFGIAKGIPGRNPGAPGDLKNAMTLYNLYVRAYTGTTRDVLAEMVDNRRFTMRDIGSLEKRIKTLEYYTSLSLLEKNTADLQIIDSNTGLSRFKNGFIVDPFTGHGVGDVGSEDYRCSIDNVEGFARPPFAEKNVNVSYESGDSSGVSKTGDLITLPFTETVLVNQTAASRTENVNPYAIFTFNGSIELSPSSDHWRDTERQPDLNVTLPDNADLLVDLAERTGIVGTQWNSWQDSWTGRSTTNVSYESILVTGNNVNAEGNNWPLRYDTLITTNTSTQVGQSRTGVKTNVTSQTVTENLGDRVVAVEIVPFMRSIDVDFSAKRLKPDTQIYIFFDGVDVNAYCKPTGGANGDDIVTDSNGAVTGTFTIPNTDTLRFRTGERVFRITDSATDNDDNTTAADVTFQAQGLLETREQTILSTRVAQVDSHSVTGNRVITRQSSSFTIDHGGWFDPLAQTFLVEEVGGCFLTKLDLYFSEKSDTLPVTIQLRTTTNGYPAPYIIPFGEVTLNPGDVNVSDDASVATTFTFPSPVYLMPNVEYCFVVMADTIDYRCWVGRIGDERVGTSQLISEQPYAGVMFKSQNASTWTADQTQDMTFRLHKAVFTTDTVGTATFYNEDVALRNLKTNPFTTTDTSSDIIVEHPSHGMQDGDYVTFAGVPSGTYNGIPHTELNATLTISDVEFDRYTITVSSTASATGEVGGTAVTATENMVMDVMQPNVEQNIFDGTSIVWAHKALTAKSVHGSQTPYVVDTSYLQFQPNENYFASVPKMIASAVNETNRNGGDRSFSAQALMVTTNANVSPVIDTERLSVIGVANVIDDPDGSNVANYVAETTASGGSALARYITKRITLEDPAIAIKAYLGANIPTNSDIEVYYRTLPVEGVTAWEDIEWTLVSSDSTLIKVDDPSQYLEYSYTVEDLSPFIAFAVKIVFTSTDSTDAPKVTDFRAIALGT